MIAKKIDRRLAAAAIVAIAVYLGLAYVLAPFFWRHFERQPELASFEATTRTALGLPGDAINVGLEGAEDDVLCAMHAAGWRPADPVTLSSSARIVGSVLFDRPYLDAPVSPLFYEHRKQDLAFEKPNSKSARTRHHVRLWKALDAGDDGLPVWLGAAVFDDGLGVSHYTGQVTHNTGPDIDAERDFLMSDLEQAKKVEEIYSVRGRPDAVFAQRRGRSLFHRWRHRLCQAGLRLRGRGGLAADAARTAADRGEKRALRAARRGMAPAAWSMGRRRVLARSLQSFAVLRKPINPRAAS